MGLRCVIYARQSQDRTGQGAAVERQVEDCRKLAEAKGWDVVEVVIDNDTSAFGVKREGQARKAKKRDGYEQVVGMLRAGTVQRIIVWNIDRLTRDMHQLESVVDLCEETGGSIATVNGDIDLSTDTGRLVARILGAVARAEVERKSARQRRANLQRAEAGRAAWSRRPYGYDRTEDGTVVVRQEEASAIRRAAERALQGATLSGICRELNAAGHATSIGGQWTVRTLRRVLTNPRYSGRTLYLKADVAEGQWPPILDADTQERLREVLRDPTRRMQQGVELKYLLSGLLLCGKCGARMYSGGTRKIQQYRCRQPHLSRHLDPVDRVVERAVLKRLQRPDAAMLLSPDVDVDALRSEASELRRRQDALAGMLADGLMSETAVRAEAKRIVERLRPIEDRISAAVTRSPVATLLDAPDIPGAWAALPIRVRRDVVDLLCTVTLLPAGKGVRFSPDMVRIDWRGGA